MMGLTFLLCHLCGRIMCVGVLEVRVLDRGGCDIIKD